MPTRRDAGGSHQPYRGCKVVEGLYAAGAHHCWVSPHTPPGDGGAGAEKEEPIPPDQEEKLLSSCNVLPATAVDTASRGGPGAEEMLEGLVRYGAADTKVPKRR